MAETIEENHEEEFDLIAELREAYRAQSKEAAYLMFGEQGEESERVQLRANLMYLAADALADAEARLNKIRDYAEDRSIHHRARKDSVVGSWRIASDLLAILDSDGTA